MAALLLLAGRSKPRALGNGLRRQMRGLRRDREPCAASRRPGARIPSRGAAFSHRFVLRREVRRSRIAFAGLLSGPPGVGARATS
ncbi:MAG TPA: hypothetical protein DEP35_04300 [Deltaproteobacteria bacterium]|nr:hypothetical protein [Deltaproteobacteria bacterium]